MKQKKSQQEIIGFVLIVVLVVVALFVFLIISLRTSPEQKQSFEVENMLSVILDYTTDCAIVYEPQYDTTEDLIKSCFENQKCSNLDKMACDYLNQTLQDIMNNLMQSESTINAYKFDILHRNEQTEQNILTLKKGNCTGSLLGAQVPIVTTSGDLIARLRVCKEN